MPVAQEQTAANDFRIESRVSPLRRVLVRMGEAEIGHGGYGIGKGFGFDPVTDGDLIQSVDQSLSHAHEVRGDVPLS